MAITVGTDTYISLADAETYFANHYLSTDDKLVAWNTLSDSDKEVLLRKATQKIDAMPYMGFKADNDQELAFPRAFWTDNQLLRENLHPLFLYGNRNWYIQTEVPDDVKYAECELAISMVSGTPTRVELQRQGVTSYSIGGDGLSESYNGKGGSYIESTKAIELLNKYQGSYSI